MHRIFLARLRIIFWYTGLYLFLVITYPILLYPKYLNFRNKIESREIFSYYFMQKFAKLMFYTSGSRMKIHGLENIPKNGPALYVSNHQGHMDSIIIQGFIKKPKGFLTITEFQKALILRTWMKYMGCVFIDRSDMRQQLTCINQATDTLKSGHSMVVFPEGKLNDGKETLKFQKGWLRMATKSKVPIVPITLKDSYKVLSYNGRRVHSARVECIISEPLYTDNLKKADEGEFILKIREIILANLNS